MNFIVELLENRKTTRSFSKKPVEIFKKKILLDALNRVPSKQNRLPAHVTILDENQIEAKNILYKNSGCWPDNTNIYNPQLLAPLVFLLSYRDTVSNIIQQHEKEKIMSCSTDLVLDSEAYITNSCIFFGIASTTILLTAESLNLQTAYCICVSSEEIYSLLNIRPVIALCVGYAREDVDDIRNRETPDGKDEKLAESETRPNISEWVDYIDNNNLLPETWQNN